MKILGIVCGPREGGNTEILAREALEEARAVGKNLVRMARCLGA